MNQDIKGRIPTIPEYYIKYINKNVDLTEAPKQCCPFHKEDTPSFSYSAEKGRWRCFGACKAGGDVVELHRRNYNLSSREEALKSLKALYEVIEKVSLNKENVNLFVNDDRVEFESLYQKALLMANCPERWLEMDYVMSKTPVEISDLKLMLDKWVEV